MKAFPPLILETQFEATDSFNCDSSSSSFNLHDQSVSFEYQNSNPELLISSMFAKQACESKLFQDIFHVEQSLLCSVPPSKGTGEMFFYLRNIFVIHTNCFVITKGFPFFRVSLACIIWNGLQWLSQHVEFIKFRSKCCLAIVAW